MHRCYHEGPHFHALIGTVAPCEVGVVRIRGHIYEMNQPQRVPVREPHAVSRFSSLAKGELIVIPFAEAVEMEAVCYQQDARDFWWTGGSKPGCRLNTLSRQPEWQGDPGCALSQKAGGGTALPTTPLTPSRELLTERSA